MTSDNCINYCAHVEEDGSCCGQCIMTIKPIETLTTEQIQREKSIHLIILGDEENA